eukprot:6951667-Prymnesium_polylepis.1
MVIGATVGFRIHNKAFHAAKSLHAAKGLHAALAELMLQQALAVSRLQRFGRDLHDCRSLREAV